MGFLTTQSSERPGHRETERPRDRETERPRSPQLSAFPHEKEYLYPSLTFLQPTGVTQTLVHDGTTFTIVEVEPSFPS